MVHVRSAHVVGGMGNLWLRRVGLQKCSAYEILVNCGFGSKSSKIRGVGVESITA